MKQKHAHYYLIQQNQKPYQCYYVPKKMQKETTAQAHGKIGQKELFYIMSRGFTQKEANKLIVRAKFNKIIESLQNEDLKCQIIKEIEQRLDQHWGRFLNGCRLIKNKKNKQERVKYNKKKNT